MAHSHRHRPNTQPTPPADYEHTLDPHTRHRHGAHYTGGNQVARIANQREDYLLATLREFKAGQRVGYTNAMNETLTGLSDEGLADIAYFLAHAPAPRP